MKLKYLLISHLFLLDTLNGKVHFKYSDPQLPDDTRIVGIENLQTRETFKILLSSASFPDVEVPEQIQIVCYGRKKDWLKAIHEKVQLS